MPTPIRIKRRLSPGAAGAPSSLYNAELAFNENDKTLYYGYGIGVGTTVATSVISIAGEGAFVTLSTGQTISGTKTFTNPINGSFSSSLNIGAGLSQNGTFYDGSANRSISLPLLGTSGIYGSSTAIPVITTDSYGRITEISTTSISTTLNLTGNSGSGSIPNGGTLNIFGGTGITTNITNGNVNLNIDNTVVTLSGIQSLTNKTFDTASTGNIFRINGNLVNGYTGTGTSVVLSNSPILFSPNIYDTNNSSGLPNQVLLKYGSGISWGPIELTATINQLTFGNYISGTPFNYFNGVNPVTFGVAATSVNTVNQVVARDASGNFSAGIITANSNVYSTVFDVTQATLTTTATTQVTLSSISSSTYSSAEYMITAIQGTNYNTTKLLLVHDGTNAYLTEYGSINVGNSVATFDADINTGNIRLLAIPASASSTKFQVAITAIRI